MRQIRKFIFAIALSLLLTISALAVEPQTPSITKSPSETVATVEDGQTQSPGAAIKVTDPTLELMLSILTSLLPLI